VLYRVPGQVPRSCTPASASEHARSGARRFVGRLVGVEKVGRLALRGEVWLLFAAVNMNIVLVRDDVIQFLAVRLTTPTKDAVVKPPRMKAPVGHGSLPISSASCQPRGLLSLGLRLSYYRMQVITVNKE
jgi:hypothetical protein